MNGLSPSGSTIRVRSDWSAAGSMCGYLWLSKTRKYRSSRTSIDEGWSISGSQGSIATRPWSISVRMSRSLSSTVGTLPGGIVGGQVHNRRMTFQRYVAIGDSFTEGVGDADPTRPNGCRGWADRVAEALARQSPDFGYANLAIRGRKLPAIIEEQVAPAIELGPDLITIHGGGNDVLRPKVDLDLLAATYDEAIGRLTGTGARVVMFTVADPGLNPVMKLIRGRTAIFNEWVREIAEKHDATLVDCWRMRGWKVAEIMDVDRLHLNPVGPPGDRDRRPRQARRRPRPAAAGPGRRSRPRAPCPAPGRPRVGTHAPRPVGRPPDHRQVVRRRGGAEAAGAQPDRVTFRLARLAAHADVAQLVERQLPKLNVASSNLVVRSQNWPSASPASSPGHIRTSSAGGPQPATTPPAALPASQSTQSWVAARWRLRADLRFNPLPLVEEVALATVTRPRAVR